MNWVPGWSVAPPCQGTSRDQQRHDEQKNSLAADATTHNPPQSLSASERSPAHGASTGAKQIARETGRPNNTSAHRCLRDAKNRESPQLHILKGAGRDLNRRQSKAITLPFSSPTTTRRNSSMLVSMPCGGTGNACAHLPDWSHHQRRTPAPADGHCHGERVLQSVFVDMRETIEAFA